MSITTTGDRLEVIHDSAADDPTQGPAGTLTSVEGSAAESGALSSSRPTFTITDAATACSVSRKTITRKLPELAGHGAAKDDDGVWRIPVEALLAVGLHPGRSLTQVTSAAARPAAPAPAPPRPPEQDTVTIPRDRWDDVRIRLARAEAEAAERGLALADARLALRALTAGPVSMSRGLPTALAQDSGTPPVGNDSAPAHASSGAQPVAIDAAQPGGEVATTSAAQVAVAVPAPVPAHGEPEVASPQQSSAGPVDDADPRPEDVVAARNLAARRGGYVPAGAAPAKKRRWWQSN